MESAVVDLEMQSDQELRKARCHLIRLVIHLVGLFFGYRYRKIRNAGIAIFLEQARLFRDAEGYLITIPHNEGMIVRAGIGDHHIWDMYSI